MTPFADRALLAMLLAFYPTVTAAALRQARSERPEYFAGGTIIGSKGDKLQLPDGRVFDLIANAGGLPGTQRWQVIEPGPSADEPWPLEPGPLTVVDEEVFTPTPGPSTTFQVLVGGAITSLGASDDVLAQGASTLADSAAAGQLALGDATDLEDADRVVEEIAGSRSADVVAELVAQSDAIGGSVDSIDADYDQAPPQPAIPNEPSVPGYPGEDGTSGEPGREDPRHHEHPDPSERHGDE